MNIIDKFKSMMARKSDEEREVLDFDSDGAPLYKDNIIAKIKEELERRKQERLPLENQWKLNANFLVGNQYCDINVYRNEVEQVENTDNGLERVTFNNIAPLVETRIANLNKISFTMKVKPRTNEIDDYAKAEVSTAILQYLQKNTDLSSKLKTLIHWNEICGNAFWLTWWDANKGNEIGREIITIEDANGVSTKEKAYYEGDIDYGLITPYEVFPESIYKQTVEAQRSIIIQQVMSVDEIEDLYGIKVEGKQVETFELTPVGCDMGSSWAVDRATMAMGVRTVENSEKVITYFEKPTKKKPDGVMAIIVGDDNLVYYGELPYGRIPIVQVVCREVAGQFFGKSVIEDLIPRQIAYNGVVSRIHEHIKRIAIGEYFVEEGSIDIEDFEQNGLTSGSLLVYKAGSQVPIRVPNSAIPSELMSERMVLKNEMEYVAGTSQLMVNGATPSGVTSGTAIENLIEIDSTRMSLTGDNIREGEKKLSIIWLEMYKRFAHTSRVVNCVGINSIGDALVWSGEDINSFDVEFTVENELMMSEEARNQKFMQSYQMGLFTDENGRIPEKFKHKALECMKLGNYTELMSMQTLHIQDAQRENKFFEKGVIPEIKELDNHTIHLEEHMRYYLDMRYQLLKNKKPDYAKAFENHLMMHKQIIDEEEKRKMMSQMMG